jgi:hypothetical protein
MVMMIYMMHHMRWAPFHIDTPVDTMQAFASKFTPYPGLNEKVRMPKDKGSDR